jgi:hypothetical protein
MSRGRKKWTRRRLRAVYYVFLTAGIMALGYAGYAVLVRYWYQDDETFKFETFSAPGAGRAASRRRLSQMAAPSARSQCPVWG